MDKDVSALTTIDRIRTLNDIFRATFNGGQVVVTPGVDQLPPDSKMRLVRAVQSFDTFDDGNDPHREHDFGAIDQDGENYFWKIDYYDLEMRFGSEDPSDPKKTTRVLTIMRADEY